MSPLDEYLSGLLKNIEAVIANRSIDEVEAENKAIARREKAESAERDRKHAEDLDRRRMAGVQEINIEATLTALVGETGDEDKVFQGVKEWFLKARRQYPGSLLLLGTNGTGKTWLGSAMVNDWGPGARIIKASRYTGAIRDSYKPTARKTELEILEEFAGYKLLVLDEVGRQFETPQELRYMFELIDERSQNLRPTVFISNLGVDEFKAAIKPENADRIRQGGTRILLLNWESRRK